MTDKIKNLKKTVVIKYALVAVIVVYGPGHHCRQRQGLY